MGLFKKEGIIIVADEETEDDVMTFAQSNIPFNAKVNVIPSGELFIIAFRTKISRKCIIRRLKREFRNWYRLKIEENLIWVTKKEES